MSIADVTYTNITFQKAKATAAQMGATLFWYEGVPWIMRKGQWEIDRQKPRLKARKRTARMSVKKDGETTDRRIAVELIRVADLLLGSRAKFLMDEAGGGEPQGRLYRSLRSLTKSNNGLWESPKQRDFIKRMIQRGGKSPTSGYFSAKMLAKAPSQPYTGIVGTEYWHGRNWGKKQRYMLYVYFVDDYGIVRELKGKMKYNEKEGLGPELVGFQVTFDRPANLGLVQEEKEDPWFDEHRKEIDFAKEWLGDNDFWKKWLGELDDGVRIPDKMWERMLEDAERESTKDALEGFPRAPTKTELELKIQFVKVYEGQYGTSVGLGGVDKRYPERCFIMVSADWLDRNLPQDMADDFDAWLNGYEDVSPRPVLKGKTMTIAGEFESDGEVIKKVKRARLKMVKIAKRASMKLRMTNGRAEKRVTEQLQGMKLKARNKGDVNSAVISGGYYAGKHEQRAYVYPGNSYGTAVWRVTFKENEALNPINNSGAFLFTVDPDLTVTRWDTRK